MERKTGIVVWINEKTGMIRSPEHSGSKDYSFSTDELPGVKVRWSVSFLPQPEPSQKHDRATDVQFLPPAA